MHDIFFCGRAFILGQCDIICVLVTINPPVETRQESPSREFGYIKRLDFTIIKNNRKIGFYYNKK